MKDFTLSNGMVIPAGNTLAFAGISMHHDEVGVYIQFHQPALTFGPIRNFSKTLNNSMVSGLLRCEKLKMNKSSTKLSRSVGNI